MCVYVRACVRACARAFVRACVRACVRVCVCELGPMDICVRVSVGVYIYTPCLKKTIANGYNTVF